MNTGYQQAGLLAYVTGLVSQELLLQSKSRRREPNPCGRTSQPGCGSQMPNTPTLGEIGKRLGRKGVAKVVASGQARRRFPAGGGSWWLRSSMVQSTGLTGRPKIDPQIEHLIVQLARATPARGYNRVACAFRTSAQRLRPDGRERASPTWDRRWPHASNGGTALRIFSRFGKLADALGRIVG
ncbi:MAG TPA: hypothetical protein VES20_19725 [Bryobacteraceae bacterium]|nr:hypothetical protein [Bryobacteraceae bacterium]